MIRGSEHDPSAHDPRGTLAYAQVLLDRGDVATAERGIARVLSMQETRPHDAHRGNFRWLYEHETVHDLNGVEFMLDALNAIAHRHASQLSPGTAQAIHDAVALGLEEIERLDVHLSYTNIALSDIANSVLGGELIGERRYVERGARRLDEWLTFTSASGAPHEFNSPTYLAVDIERMATLAEHTRDPQIAKKAREAEALLWRHVAAHYHPKLAQLAGPHSRSYFDGWTAETGYLKLILWRILGDEKLRRRTPWFSHGREEGHIGVATSEFHCPDDALELLRAKSYPVESRETSDASRGLDLTTYMTDGYALGTASKPFAGGERPEVWPGFNSILLHAERDDPVPVVLSARYILNDNCGDPIESGGAAEPHDCWDDGQFAGAQYRNRAIVAYGLMPRLRPIVSAKTSVRILGIRASDAIFAGDTRVTSLPAIVEPQQRIVIDVGSAYVALIPLSPTHMGSDAAIVLDLKGELLTLDIYNYRGPAKSFWEYRSLSGAFFKGNVRNGLILEAAEPREHDTLDAFRRHVEAARIEDRTDADRVRTIAYTCRCGSIELRYSLIDMSLVERRFDGDSYRAPASSVTARG